MPREFKNMGIKNMGKIECESAGKIWVEGHYRGGFWVHSHCRDRTKKEINSMPSQERKDFEKHSSDLSGQWKGVGYDASDAVDSLLQELDLPTNGGGEDLDLSDPEGNPISADDWEQNGGRFSTTIYKNGRHYFVSGISHRGKGKDAGDWVARAEIEDMGFS